MARVMSSLRILPADAEINLDSLKEAIQSILPPDVSVHRFEEEPIAFGLKALHAHILMPEDTAGLIDRIEENLKNLEGVGQVDTLMVRRL